MARSTSLSEKAFETLRREKGPNETDSDVILRLAAEAHARRKDPFRLAHIELKLAPEYASLDALEREIMKSRDGDRGDSRSSGGSSEWRSSSTPRF
ncbi:MAG: hypothetical protein ACYDDF_05590 [Thermoplasmatota archaeon]